MRPRVLCNMAASLDGKIGPSRRDRPFAMSRQPVDHERMRALRAGVDAVVIGAGNLRADDPDLAPARRRVLVTTRGDGVHDACRFFVPPPVDRGAVEASAERGPPAFETIVAHATTMPVERRALFSERATLLELGTPGAPDAITRLLAWLSSERGCKTVLCEGGGILVAAFFAARAIDELHLTLVPRILGGANAPTPVAGGGFDVDAIPDARLTEVDRLGDELFLRYAFPWHEGGAPNCP